MGVVECLNHKLVEPFNVLYEKEGKEVETDVHRDLYRGWVTLGYILSPATSVPSSLEFCHCEMCDKKGL